MDWELNERSKKCIRCEKDFIPGENYNSLLYLEKDKLVSKFPDKENLDNKNIQYSHLKNTGFRVELCPDCSKDTNNSEYDSFWMGEIQEKKENKEEVSATKLNKEDVLNILKKYLNEASVVENEEDKIDRNGVAYFLAVMLERKNYLQYRRDEEREEDGIRVAVYERNKTGDMFKIPYPILSKENVLHYQEKIFKILGVKTKKDKTENKETPEPVESETVKKEEG